MKNLSNTQILHKENQETFMAQKNNIEKWLFAGLSSICNFTDNTVIKLNTSSIEISIKDLDCKNSTLWASNLTIYCQQKYGSQEYTCSFNIASVNIDPSSNAALTKGQIAKLQNSAEILSNWAKVKLIVIKYIKAHKISLDAYNFNGQLIAEQAIEQEKLSK